jgi:CMP-N,N'-diacetyllegionaminic acid synthase
MPKIYAFIPARSGSERVKDKNIKKLHGKPLIEYTIDQAKSSKLITKTYISTDYKHLNSKININEDVKVIIRPKNISKNTSLDIDWILHLLKKIKNDMPDLIVLLRPTSPFRNHEFIDISIKKLLAKKDYDSARAVTLVKEHPDKMWIKEGEKIIPLGGFNKTGEDFHSMQYKSLRKVYVQTSSLEILRTKSLIKNGTLSGKKVLPIFSDYLNSFSIDYEEDFETAKKIFK